MKHCMKIADQNPTKFLDIDYKELIKNPIKQMENVYDFIGKTYTNQSEKEMKNWMG